MQGEAQEIYEKFLNPQSEKQVNVSGQQLSILKSNIQTKKIDNKSFDNLKKEIFYLMESDPFPRFQKDPLYWR
jgi:hypothetical protein